MYGMDTQPSSAAPQNFCPYARTLIGHDSDNALSLVVPLRCKCWTCEYCALPNELALRARVLDGKPNRMLTLTCRPLPNEEPTHTHFRIKPSISRLYQHLRHEVGSFEAATFKELHGSGQPHWHALVRSPFVDHQTIRKKWQQLTGSFIIDIRRIESAKVALNYVSKYVAKQMKMVRALKVGLVCSFTRKYAPPQKPDAKMPGVKWQLDIRHPETVLKQFFPGSTPEWRGHIAVIKHQSIEELMTTRAGMHNILD